MQHHCERDEKTNLYQNIKKIMVGMLMVIFAGIRYSIFTFSLWKTLTIQVQCSSLAVDRGTKSVEDSPGRCPFVQKKRLESHLELCGLGL